MVKIDDVKELSHMIVESHNSRGFSLVKLTPTDPDSVGVLVNLSKVPVVRPGKELRAKADVRKFLWDLTQAADASLRRKNRTWIWTRYIKDQDVSLIGLAAQASREVAERLATRNENYQFIEVNL
jgi:hypothetical protein